MDLQIDFINFAVSMEFGKDQSRTYFPDVFIRDIASRVRMTQTRGGRILEQVLLRKSHNNYVWVIVSETMGGGWLNTSLAAGLDKLASIATVYSRQFYDSCYHNGLPDQHGLSRYIATAEVGSKLRVIRLRANLELDDKALTDALQEVDLHAANRIGHATIAQALLLGNRSPNSDEGKHYLWLIGHQIHESFSDQDSFKSDIGEAYQQVDSLVRVLGFVDFDVVAKMRENDGGS